MNRVYSSITFAVVKTIGYILALYVLVLTFIPCCLFDNCEEDEVKTEQYQPNDQQNNNEEGKGVCSPFASCSSCNGFVVKYAEIKIHSAVCCVKHYPVFNHSHSSYYFASIWQPPRPAVSFA